MRSTARPGATASTAGHHNKITKPKSEARVQYVPALLMLTMTMSHCRYMKCLTIGMNPNYVLSEDEKKKRFRRKNNSGGGTDEENVKSPAVAVVTGGFNTGMQRIP